jgi:hypothetical protein
MHTFAASVVTDTPGISFPLLVIVPEGPDVEKRAAICARVTAEALLIAQRAGTNE